MKLISRTSLRKFSYGSRLRPARDWFLLVACFFALLLASVAWNAWEFSRVAAGQKIGNVTVPVPAQIKLDTVQALFTARATERTRYEQEYRFVDPSQ